MLIDAYLLKMGDRVGEVIVTGTARPDDFVHQVSHLRKAEVAGVLNAATIDRKANAIHGTFDEA